MGADRGTTGPPDPHRRFFEERDRQGDGNMVGLGFQFAAAILLGVFAGQWVDRRFATDPWGVLVGAFLGFAAGFYSILRTVTEAERRRKERDERDKRERDGR